MTTPPSPDSSPVRADATGYSPAQRLAIALGTADAETLAAALADAASPDDAPVAAPDRSVVA